MLDSMAAVIAALEGKAEDAMLAAAVEPARSTLEAFTAKPNKLGRARSYGERSVGLPDPGQLAFCRIIEGLAG